MTAAVRKKDEELTTNLKCIAGILMTYWTYSVWGSVVKGLECNMAAGRHVMGKRRGILIISVMLLSGVIPGRSASDVEAKCEVKNIDIFILQNRNAAGARMCSGMCFSFLCHAVRMIVWRNVCTNFLVFVLFRCMFMLSGGQLRRFYVTGKPVLSYQMCFSVCP